MQNSLFTIQIQSQFCIPIDNESLLCTITVRCKSRILPALSQASLLKNFKVEMFPVRSASLNICLRTWWALCGQCDFATREKFHVHPSAKNSNKLAPDVLLHATIVQYAVIVHGHRGVSKKF